MQFASALLPYKRSTPPPHRAPDAIAATGRVLRPDHTKPLIELKRKRTAMPTLRAQADAVNRTRGAAPGPQSEATYAARRADLDSDAAETELHATATSTDSKKDTALRWWGQFVLYIGLRVHLLSFDPANPEARAFVTSLARQFLCFVYRAGGNSGGDGPIAPESVVRYWRTVREFHNRLDIDLSFTDTT
jgi:hypothetical protein